MRLLASGRLREEERGRHYVALTLAEAETIRRVMHLRLERELIDGSGCSLALRCLPAENSVIDVSHQFPPGQAYQQRLASQSLRYLNCDMYYKEDQLSVLLRGLQESSTRERRIFFERTIGCRRRMRRKWEETPLSKLFTLPDEFYLLKQRAQSVRTREAIKAKGMLLYDAFRMFDYRRNGLLSPAELWGALEWLGLDLGPHDILDFVRTADTDRDGNISYREFLDMVRDPDATLEDLEKEHLGGGDAVAAGAATAELVRIEPKGAEELRVLQEELSLQEKEQEELEAAREQEQELKIRRVLSAEERERDMQQVGGPNPKIGIDNVRYDFSTGRRPRLMQARGDFSYQGGGSGDPETFVKVYAPGVFFLPTPVPRNGGGSKINQYSVTMEVMLDELPAVPGACAALFSTARFNETPSWVYVRSDGAIGGKEHFDERPEYAQDTPKVRLSKGSWAVVTIAVDNVSGQMHVYVGGKLASWVHDPERLAIDGFYAVDEQICLFGSKQQDEMAGGNLRFVLCSRAVPGHVLFFF